MRETEKYYYSHHICTVRVAYEKDSTDQISKRDADCNGHNNSDDLFTPFLVPPLILVVGKDTKSCKTNHVNKGCHQG